MKKYVLIIFSVLMSCSELIDPPKNLVAKETMSEIIAEFAVNDQLNSYLPNTNIETATRMALRQRKVKAAEFMESYKYYVATGELDKILDDAQQIILDKDEASRKFIEKKLTETKNVPAFAR